MHRGALIVPPTAPTSAEALTCYPVSALPVHIGPETARHKRTRLECTKQMAALDTTKAEPFLHVYAGCTAAGSVEALTVFLQGRPQHTPYAAGSFELSVASPADFPFKAPRVRFVTPIYHFAVNTQGGICLPALYDNWGPATPIASVLNSAERLT